MDLPLWTVALAFSIGSVPIEWMSNGLIIDWTYLLVVNSFVWLVIGGIYLIHHLMYS